MDDRDYSPAPTAARFQSGTPPVPSLYAGFAGLRLVLEAGVERTSARIAELTQALMDGTSRRVVTPQQRGALVCVEVDDPASVVERLRQQGVVTSWRDRSVRFSFHFYNDESDVEAALAALANI
jgi:selenocysteine lyase/cysteine desulfurase